MKYAILGDIHGNLEALKAVLERARELGCDHFACIGDIVGYNANPHECLELFRSLDPVGVVKGNHDEYISNGEETVGFNPLAARAVEWTREQLLDEELEWLAELPYTKICTAPGFGRFQLVHATLDHPEGWGYILDRFTAETNFEYQHFAICFVGHTHIPVAFEKYEGIKGGLFSGTLQLERNKKYLVNVGSVGQPRDGNPQAAFVEFAPAEMKVTLHRVDYDMEATCKKILSADLPPRLAERLAVGR